MTAINLTPLENTDTATADLFNERFAAIAQVLNKGIDSDNIKDGGITAALLANDMLNKQYPVGSLYFNATVDTNPATLLGFGTWTPFATGRTIVGFDGSQTEFNAVQKTGGSNTHNHGLASGSALIGSPNSNANALGFKSSQIGSLTGSTYSVGNSPSATTDGHPNRSHNTALDGSTDSGTTLQPYITVYIWVRTA